MSMVTLRTQHIPNFTCVRAHMGELLVMFDLAPVWEVLVARATEL